MLQLRMPDLRHWFPFLNWPRPDAALLRNEMSAAITVALVMIPQSVAYAGLAGMPLITGLYATFLPALVAVLFSASTRLSVGPSALSSVLVGASVLGMAEPASAQWVSLVVWLALMSGGIQLALGATGSSWVLNLVSSPVLAGFSQAAALLIIASQLPALIGLQGDLASLLHHPQFDLVALGFGVVSLTLFVLGKRFAPRLPMVLLMLAASAALSWYSGYSSHGAVIGALPVGLPSLYLPGLPAWNQLTALVAPALVIALVSSLEMASSAKIESQRDDQRGELVPGRQAGQVERRQALGRQPGPDRPGPGQAHVRVVRQFPHQHIVLALGDHAVCRCEDRLGHRGGQRPRAAGAAVPDATAVASAARRAVGGGDRRGVQPVQAADLPAGRAH
jgi:SulP family sulfate permease